MKSTAAYKSGLEKLATYWKRNQFNKALILVHRLLADWPDNPHLLIKKAQLIQLQESEDGPTLEDVRAILNRASDLDEESPQPLIELGYFHYAVEDDAATAVQSFSKAESLLVDMLKECRKGKKAALAEQSELGHTNGKPSHAKDRKQRPRTVSSSS